MTRVHQGNQVRVDLVDDMTRVHRVDLVDDMTRVHRVDLVDDITRVRMHLSPSSRGDITGIEWENRVRDDTISQKHENFCPHLPTVGHVVDRTRFLSGMSAFCTSLKVSLYI